MAAVDGDTPEMKVEFEAKKSKLFKASIAVCVAYGVVAAAFFAAILTNERARDLLTETFAPFTVTFVIGTVSIMIWLAVVVSRFKPPSTSSSRENDMLRCPDYFELKRTPESVVNRFGDDMKHLVAYRCVANPNVYSLSNMPAVSYAGSNLTFLSNVNIPSKFNIDGLENEYKMTCCNIYPQYMFKLDAPSGSNLGVTNRYRCGYMQACSNSFTWSAVCPNGFSA